MVFKIDPHGNESTFYSFTGEPDGGQPEGALILDQQGNLYGTTNTGGNQTLWGVVFKLDPAGRETVLYAFNGLTDGGGPFATALARDHNGSLYGIAQSGGDLSGCGGGGCGVIFKIAACHTATCHGEDDADTATTNSAAVTQHPSTVALANPGLRDRGTMDRLRARQFPAYPSFRHATPPTN